MRRVQAPNNIEWHFNSTHTNNQQQCAMERNTAVGHRKGSGIGDNFCMRGVGVLVSGVLC